MSSTEIPPGSSALVYSILLHSYINGESFRDPGCIKHVRCYFVYLVHCGPLLNAGRAKYPLCSTFCSMTNLMPMYSKVWILGDMHQ
jgi:hypothetical protein